MKQPKPLAPLASIETLDDVRDGIKYLRRRCTFLRTAHDLSGDPPLRREPAGFAGLARIVVGQQVSVASARAIWGRFSALVDPVDAAGIMALDDDALRSVGLSRPKVRTLRAMTAAVAAGFDIDALATDDDEAVRQALCSILGIGPWTADVYLMFCLGRRDTFAPGDLALQVAAQSLMGLDGRPGPIELASIAERWRPWRAVAARMLWAYYAAIRKGAAQPV